MRQSNGDKVKFVEHFKFLSLITNGRRKWREETWWNEKTKKPMGWKKNERDDSF